MHSKDATPLLAKRLRETPKFFIEVPLGNKRGELEIVRRATREPDPIIRQSRKIDKIDIAFITVGVVSVLAYVALLAGWLDFLKPLFI